MLELTVLADSPGLTALTDAGARRTGEERTDARHVVSRNSGRSRPRSFGIFEGATVLFDTVAPRSPGVYLGIVSVLSAHVGLTT
jgi:hypothetical protein